MKHAGDVEMLQYAKRVGKVRRFTRPQFGRHSSLEGSHAAAARASQIRSRLNATIMRRWVSREYRAVA